MQEKNINGTYKNKVFQTSHNLTFIALGLCFRDNYQSHNKI